MSMGMMMLPPVLISLPFKILLFVLVDGWHLVDPDRSSRSFHYLRTMHEPGHRHPLAIQAMTVALEVSAPFLLAGLVVGLLVSIFQAATSIQEQTLSFIPKILVTGAVIAVAGPWMLDQLAGLHPEPVHEHPVLVGP